MVYRRRRNRRRRFKRTMTRRGAMVDLGNGQSRFWSGFAPTRNQVGLFKLRGINFLTSSAGSSINVIVPLTRPDLYDGTNPVTDWSPFVALYDVYCVSAIKVKFIPTSPDDASAATSYRPIYTYIDLDDTALSLADSDAIGYDNLKIFDLNNPWKRYFRVPKQVASGVSSVGSVGWFDTALPVSTGAMYISKAGSLTASKTYGTIIITYYIKGRNRR